MILFSKRLKEENELLKEELSSMQQVRESLDSEMIAITLDANGEISAINTIYIN